MYLPEYEWQAADDLVAHGSAVEWTGFSERSCLIVPIRYNHGFVSGQRDSVRD